MNLLIAIAIIFCLSILSGCTGKAGAKIQSQLDLAVKCLSENNFQEAILAYREVIKIDPKNVVAYKGIALTYSVQGKYNMAEQALQEGINNIEGDKSLKLSLAGVLADWGKTGQAEEVYREVINQDSKYLPAYQAYSKFLSNLGRQTDAIALMEKAASEDPGNYKSHSLLAGIYAQNGLSNKALTAVNKSLTIEPNQAESYRILEQIYSGRWEDLIFLGEEYISQNNAIAGNVLKLTGLYNQCRYDELIGQFELLDDSVKACAKARLLAARAYLKLGKTDLATGLFKDFDHTAAKDPSLLAEIAAFYLDAGDGENAQKLAAMGISLDDMSLENYQVLYRRYLSEDKTQSDLWMTKYMLNSTLSTAETKKERESIINPVPAITQKPAEQKETVSEDAKPQSNPQAPSSKTTTENNFSSPKEVAEAFFYNYIKGDYVSAKKLCLNDSVWNQSQDDLQVFSNGFKRGNAILDEETTNSATIYMDKGPQPECLIIYLVKDTNWVISKCKYSCGT